MRVSRTAHSRGVAVLTLSVLVVIVGSRLAGAQSLPKVHVIATGGTIASTGPGQAHISGEDLVRSVPGIDKIAQISVEQFSNIGSEYMTPELWKALAIHLNQVFHERPDVDGIVVTHGTDTLEETAYFLDLTVGGDRPVVLTAAMRDSRAISPDGPANLFAAISVAASAAARRRGILVVMNDNIFSAHDLTKRNTLRVDAFQSPDSGPLGSYDRGEIHFFRAPSREPNQPPAFSLNADTVLPKVGIVMSYAGADGTPMKAFADAGVSGIVVAAFAGWSVSREQEQTIANLARKGVVVVLASRTNGGRIVLEDRVKWKTVLKESMPVIGSGSLNPQKARILLMLALANTKDRTKLQELFAAQ